MVKLFPFWVIVAAGLGMGFPEWLSPLDQLIVPLLMVVMLGMGLTLTPGDFFNLKTYKLAVTAGVVLQFTVMPLMAFAISKLFSLGPELTSGMVLVGSVAGGTASNVMTLLARGNVALSVSMTAISTLASVVMTPLLMTLLVGAQINVPTLAMLESLCKIILLPVFLGILINVYGNRWVSGIKPALPVIAVTVILLIIAIVIALNAERLAAVAYTVIAATLIHNLSGMFLGYGAAHLLGFNRIICRTIAIEVGMQNSGLATALALKFFGPVAALPGAIFSVWLNATGSVFAALCNNRDNRRRDQGTAS